MDTLIHENAVISIREITPLNASRILEDKNLSNRSISDDRVRQYKKAMVDGEWLFNGDPIRFSSDKVLSDGQHRLKAVVLSGLTQSFLIVENLPKKTRLTIDIGKNRSGGDVLAIEAGVGNGIASCISGSIHKYTHYKDSGVIGSGGRARLTNTQLIASYRDNESLLSSRMAWMYENLSFKGALIPKSDVLFLLMVTGEICTEQSNQFIKSVLSGVGISEDGQISYLREYLINCKTGLAVDTSLNKLKTILKVWNSLRKGKEIKQRKRIKFNSQVETFKKAI